MPHTHVVKRIVVCCSLIFTFLFLKSSSFVARANEAALPYPGEKTGNRYSVQAAICYGEKFLKISHLRQLPPALRKLIEGLSDRGGEFNSSDVGDGPRSRLLIGAANNDVVVLEVEHGGIGYNIQLWTFLKNGTSWEYGPAVYSRIRETLSLHDLLAGISSSFSCKGDINTTLIQNDNDATNAIRRDAELGDANAQFYLAHRYAIGHGVDKSTSEAEKWYRQAAEKHTPLQYELGILYVNGKEITQNYVQAKKYFEMVASPKNVGQNEELRSMAYYQLGLIYERGLGVPADKVIASTMFRFAQRYGDHEQAAHIAQFKAGLTMIEAKQADK